MVRTFCKQVPGRPPASDHPPEIREREGSDRRIQSSCLHRIAWEMSCEVQRARCVTRQPGAKIPGAKTWRHGAISSAATHRNPATVELNKSHLVPMCVCGKHPAHVPDSSSRHQSRWETRRISGAPGCLVARSKRELRLDVVRLILITWTMDPGRENSPTVKIIF